MKPTRIKFPVVSFRHLETPFQKQGCRNYFAIVETNNLPDLSDWRKINVRDPKLTGSVPKAIRESFHDKPDLFVFMNRGLVLAVDKVEFDNKSSSVTVDLTNPRLHGLLDGGHTYNIVMEETGKVSETHYVRVEFLEGFNHDGITEVVDARNTSNQVRDESLMNLAGEFEALKRALKGARYFDQIAFKEYEVDAAGDPKPIDVREVVAILTAFDRDNFNDSAHPVIAYNSKAACLRHLKNNAQSYRKIYPLAKEMLALYDHIREQLPSLYNKARGQAGAVSGGKFGALTGVTYRANGKPVEHLYYIGKDSMYGVPDGFTYPILGAFRALLTEQSGRYIWGKGLDPVAILKGEWGLKLANIVGEFALDNQNPSKTGKSSFVWRACYQSILVDYLQATQR
ncbi:MAG: AIPR family protein [Acidobacteria bacterium]|nr:AIPR family protein [Acidobacteriota bacterium]